MVSEPRSSLEGAPAREQLVEHARREQTDSGVDQGRGSARAPCRRGSPGRLSTVAVSAGDCV